MASPVRLGNDCNLRITLKSSKMIVQDNIGTILTGTPALYLFDLNYNITVQFLPAVIRTGDGERIGSCIK